ncbi:MAG TPA: hypothetical protein VGL86_19825 [Polyangia bacterium]
MIGARMFLVAFVALCAACGDHGDAADAGADDLAVGSGPEDLARLMDMSRPRVQCSPSDDDGGISGCADISGQMNGYYVPTVRSAFAVITPTSFNVYIADRADLCSILQTGSSTKDTSFMRVGSTADAPQGFPAGSYGFPSGAGSGNGMGGGPVDAGVMGTRNAVIARSGDDCLFAGYDQAAYGGFVVDQPIDANSTVVTGNFDVTFEAGALDGEIQGSFVAPVCPNAVDLTFLAPSYCE